MHESRLAARLALIFGAVFCVDLFLFVDPATDFVTRGTVWLRYGGMALMILVLFLLARRLPGEGAPRIALSPAMAPAFVAMSATLLLGAALALLVKCSLPRMVLALAALLGAGWMAATAASCKQGAQREAATLPGGLASAVALLLLCLLRYIERPTSNQHLTRTVGLSAAIFALLFIAALLRAVYLEDARQGRTLFFFGMTGFFLGDCLLIPKTLFLLLRGGFSLRELAFDLPLMGLGLLGLAFAKAAAAPKQQAE